MTRVLIVDDNEDSLLLIRLQLEQNSFEIDEALHGAEALEKAQQNPPNLIISDLLMPGMDGFTLLRHWKADARLNAIPFIVYSATYTGPRDRQLALDLGADDFVVKPANPVDFLLLIQKLLNATETRKPVYRTQEQGPVHFKEYSEVLIRKLEEKTLELEKTNHELQDEINARKIAEAALRDSENRLRAIIATSPECIKLVNRTGELHEMNPAGLAMLEAASLEQAQQKPLLELIKPEYRHAFGALHQKVMLGENGSLEFQIMGLNGGERWLETHATPLRDSAGEIKWLLGITRDITDRRKSEETLHASEKYFRALIERSHDAIILFNADGIVQYASPSTTKILGYLPDELRYRIFMDFVRSDCHDSVMERLAESLRLPGTGVKVSAYVRHKSGEWRFLEGIFTNLLMYPEVRAVVNNYRDVTERMQMEAALVQSEERLRLAVQASNVGLWDWNLQTNQVTYSREWKRQLGYEESEIGNEFSEWERRVHPDDLIQTKKRIQRRLTNPEGVHDLEFRMRHKDGTWRWIYARGELIRSSDGKPARMLGCHLDITDRRALESQFLHAQKMEAVGQLAGGVAHDFNNLLQVITGNCELMLARLSDSNQLRKDIALIQQSAKRGARLTQQLLSFSRRQVMSPKVLSLNSLISNMAEMLGRLINENITIKIVPESNLKPIMADPGMIEQVLVNLLVNARDAMPDGGCITVETKNVNLDETYVRTHPDTKSGPHAMLVVGDNGCGMGVETLSRIFEPFFTTKTVGKGTGLGLSTVHGIVRQSGGIIEVNSEVGIGTTFRIYFPIADGEGYSDPSNVLMPAIGKGEEVILVAEDDEYVRVLVRELLRMNGKTVLTAADGTEALRVCQESRRKIDLLITDVTMPKMGGRELAQNFKRLYPGSKVLFISGFMNDIDDNFTVGSEFNFLQKPFTSAELTSKIHEILHDEHPHQRL